MPRLASTVVWLSIIGCVGCHIFDEHNPQSCELPENKSTPACKTGPSCDGDEACMGMPGMSVCDTTMNLCVPCTDKHNACMNPTPACVNETCQVCTSHSQCSSRACLPDGTCATAADIAYVRPDGSGTTCTDSAPCKTLTDGLNAGKATVKVEGNITDTDVATATTSVTILADTGSQVTRSSPGTILVVGTDQADVHISDLRITGGMGVKGDIAVSVSGGSNPKLTLLRVQIDNNVGTGIAVTAGTLTVTQSTITGNGALGVFALNSTLATTQSTISNNAGGGIAVNNGNFDITNNFITSNGASTMFGGAIINMVNSGTRRFEFNTVTDNNASAGNTTGVSCMGIMPASPITLSNNIVFDNEIGNSRTQISDPNSNCNWTYSNIGDSTSTKTTTDAQGNKDADPLFIDVVGNNYHLKSGSPVKDAADPAATINVDFDGDTRPQGNRSDMGADEIVSSP
jgi:hypothetical protein